MASDSFSPRSSVSPPPDLTDTNVSNKSVWNKPSVVEPSPVMGALSWPPLSDSAKGSPKSSSDSLKTLSDGSASASASPAPLVAANATPNHQFPTRQRSFNKRSSGGSRVSANGPSSQLTVQVTHNHSTKSTPAVLMAASPRDSPHKGGQRTGMVSQSHKGNDHQHNSPRRAGGGHHPGDASNYYNHGKRRGDQVRPNHEQNISHQAFNGRDGHIPQRVNQRNFARPMQQPTPFVSPPPIPPFGNLLGFPDMTYYVPSPDSMRGVPFFHAAPLAMIVPAPDPQLRIVLAKQIEYYFSPENLCKDIFLRKHMDAEGWVIVSLIANFNRVKQLTNNTQFILDSLRDSIVVEVQGDKVRKRNDWMNWTLLPSQPASASDPLSAGVDHDRLVNHMKNVGLEEGDTVT